MRVPHLLQNFACADSIVPHVGQILPAGAGCARMRMPQYLQKAALVGTGFPHFGQFIEDPPIQLFNSRSAL
jgi:hypothetical protein